MVILGTDFLNLPSDSWQILIITMHQARTLLKLRRCPGCSDSESSQLVCHFKHWINWALSQENLSTGFLTKQDSNQSPQLHGLARKLKFRLKQV